MNGKRYPKESKIEAVKQVTIAGHSVVDVAGRLGTTDQSRVWCKALSTTRQNLWAPMTLLLAETPNAQKPDRSSVALQNGVSKLLVADFDVEACRHLHWIVRAKSVDSVRCAGKALKSGAAEHWFG